MQRKDGRERAPTFIVGAAAAGFIQAAVSALRRATPAGCQSLAATSGRRLLADNLWQTICGRQFVADDGQRSIARFLGKPAFHLILGFAPTPGFAQTPAWIAICQLLSFSGLGGLGSQTSAPYRRGQLRGLPTAGFLNGSDTRPSRG